jgi:hypothetical protein
MHDAHFLADPPSLLLIPHLLAWHCEFFFFAHHSSPSPSHPLHHCPFTPVEPGYGVDLFENNYLFLLSAADLRMDPPLRPRPVSSVAFAYLGNTPQLVSRVLSLVILLVVYVLLSHIPSG